MKARTLEYHPAARTEFLEAVEAVESFTGRGASFDAEARRAEAGIIEAPGRHPLEVDAPAGFELRRARIGRYP